METEEDFARIMDCCVELMPDGRRCERSDVARFGYCADHYARHKCASCDKLNNADCKRCAKTRRSLFPESGSWRTPGFCRCATHTVRWKYHVARCPPFDCDSSATEFLCPSCIVDEAARRNALLCKEDRLARIRLDATFDAIRHTPILDKRQCDDLIDVIAEGSGLMTKEEAAVYNRLREASKVFDTNVDYARCMLQRLISINGT